MAQQVITINDGSGSANEVLFLPFSATGNTFSQNLGIVKNHHKLTKSSDFDSKLNELAQKTIKESGNVFQITSINNRNQKNRYKIKGTVFHADHYDELKSKVMELKNKNLENGKYAVLTIYRPVYVAGMNDEVNFDIIINDTMRLTMSKNTKYIIKIGMNCNLKFSINDDNIVQHMDIKKGNRYYIRTLANFPGSGNQVKDGERTIRLRNYDPYFEVIDDKQGDLESSLVNSNTIISKKM